MSVIDEITEAHAARIRALDDDVLASVDAVLAAIKRESLRIEYSDGDVLAVPVPQSWGPRIIREFLDSMNAYCPLSGGARWLPVPYGVCIQVIGKAKE